MAEYTLTCMVCSNSFEATRRHAKTCSKHCQNRLRYGVGVADCQDAESLLSCTPAAPGETASERVYSLYRGRLDRADVLTVDRYGVVISGCLKGRTLREVLETAAREGWLAYRQRPDGWYSAEWWPEGKRIALCGPVKALPSSRIVSREMVAA